MYFSCFGAVLLPLHGEFEIPMTVYPLFTHCFPVLVCVRIAAFCRALAAERARNVHRSRVPGGETKIEGIKIEEELIFG